MGLRADNLNVRVVVAWAWGSYLGDEEVRNGIRVRTSSFPRFHVNVTMCRAKVVGHYVNSIMAMVEALRRRLRRGAAARRRRVRHGGQRRERLHRERRRALYPGPDLRAGRHHPRHGDDAGARAGLEVVEKRITRDEVYIADEAFFTGTAAEVTPIREVDGRSIGTGTRGPVTERLQSLYFDVVHGRSEAHLDWLTLV